ncbi:MAG: MBOAT family protein [Candidatus Electrothrix sp. MAN1_4]|nr:MBOAT family protein [Candidatus Electrothrix sp. MAN1_4]
MPFYSITFLFFFLPTILIGCHLSGSRLRSVFLFISSLLFYLWGSFHAIQFLLLIILGNYIAGILLSKLQVNWHRRSLFFLGIAANIFPLLYYKYSTFLQGIIFLPFAAPDASLTPLGISFITFHAISYLTDVFRGTASAQKNFVQLGLYFSFFPKIASGPIQQYTEAEHSLAHSRRRFTDFSLGVERFIIGLSKKLLLANVLAEVANQAFDSPAAGLSVGIAWLGAVSYTFQIYYDFSGYTDMAVGLGLMCGLRLPENFNYPYAAQSVREFWQRWHITLSQWFRDYLYIPLGGNRHGRLRTYCNLCLVFLLCGLWHGANWTFLVWGLMHGIFLVLERLFLADLLARLPKIFRHGYLLLFVLVSWVLFREENLNEAWTYLRVMAGFPVNPIENPWILLKMDRLFFSILGISFFLAFPFFRQARAAAVHFSGWFAVLAEVLYGMALLLLFVFSLLDIASGTHNSFIYFQF